VRNISAISMTTRLQTIQSSLLEEVTFETEEFEDTKGIIRICKLKRTDNTMAKRKTTKGQTTIYPK
jgi:hypothetical protein